MAALLVPGVVIAAKRIISSSRGVEQRAVNFARTVHDFGPIAPDQEFHCEFRYVNAGQKPIVIQSLSTTCGCVATTSKGGTSRTHPIVLPGETGSIDVAFNTRGMRPPSSIHKGIWVQFEHELAPRELELRGDLRPEIVVEPAALEFAPPTGVDGEAAQATATVTIRRELLSAAAFAEVSLHSEVPYFQISETARSGDHVEYRVTLLGDKAPAVLRALTVLRPNVSAAQALRVVANYGRASSDIHAAPTTYFASVDRTAGAEDLKGATLHKFQLVSDKRRDFKITRISARREADAEFLAWEVSQPNSAASGPGSQNFSLWLSRLPEQAIYATVLSVGYESSDGSRGLVNVDVRVFAGPGESVARVDLSEP